MFSIKNNILYFIVFNILVQIQCLVELPVVEDNEIVATELAVRNTVNGIFSRLKLKRVKHKARFGEFVAIHNFFVSITLQDYNNLKDIARLAQVDNIDNNTQLFITQINEVLNEDNKSHEETDDAYLTTYVEEFIKKLEYLKDKYGLKNHAGFDINTEILKHLNTDDNFLQNVTKKVQQINESDDRLLNSDEFWKPSGRRVFAGRRESIKRFPFMASVQFFKKFQCGGSIIKSDLVITSASCLQLAYNNRFFRENPAFLSVQVGCDRYEGCDENIPVLEVYFHLEYNPKTLVNNLAIMRLTRCLLFGKRVKKIKKIDFDRNPWPLPENTAGITIIGWGARSVRCTVYTQPVMVNVSDPMAMSYMARNTRAAQSHWYKSDNPSASPGGFSPLTKIKINNVIKNPWSNQLSFAELDFYPLKECQEVYSKEYVTYKNFCAGFFSKGGGACNRDVGGPGVSHGILLGVISFGSPVCGAPDAPTVFTKLGYYTDWIEEIMEQDVPTGRVRTTLRTSAVTYNIMYQPEEPVTWKIKPIIDTNQKIDQIPIQEADTLRTLDENVLFKEFISTMFGSEEVKEYLDQYEYETDKSKEETTTQQHPTKKITRANIQPTTIPTTKVNVEEQIPANLIDDAPDSDQAGSVKMVTTIEKFDRLESDVEVGTVPSVFMQYTALDAERDDDKNVEENIAKLLNDIDIQELLESESSEPSSDDEKVNTPERDEKMQKEELVRMDESEESEDSSSDDDDDDSGGGLLSLLDTPNSNKNVKKEDTNVGLSIPEESFKDFTFRQNSSAILNFLSQGDLMNLLNEAVADAAKKNKAYKI